MQNTAVWVNRGDYQRTRLVMAEEKPLADGQVRVEVEKFALTANNVTYAASGDLFGYWQLSLHLSEQAQIQELRLLHQFLHLSNRSQEGQLEP